MTILENLLQNMYGNTGKKLMPESVDANRLLKTLRADEAAKLLEGLMDGETTSVRGKVLDLRQNMISLQLPDGGKLDARTETTLPLSIGDTAEFLVTGKDGKVVTLKLAQSEAPADDQTQKIVTKALEAAGITKTERSEAVARELLGKGQPVNEANIKRFLALSAKNPDVPIRELVLLDTAKIPLTKENIQIYKDFGNSEPVAEFAAAVSELSEAVEALPDGALKEEFAEELKSIVKELIPGEETAANETETQGSVKEGTAAETAKEAAVEMPGTARDANNADIKETAVEKPQAEETKPEAQATPQKAGTDTPDVPKAEVPDRDAAGRSANKIHRELHMPPKDFSDSENVKKLYEKLDKASERLKKLEERIMSHTNEEGKEGALKQPQTHASRLSSTLKFMDSVNSIFPYVQLPIKLKEENARGDLYVYEKKRAIKPGDTVSALLHLALDNLGDTDILIKLTGNNAVITISASTDESREVFESEIPPLKEALGKKGYSLNCDVNVRDAEEEKAPLLTRFLEAHSPSTVSRFSFDMRA